MKPDVKIYTKQYCGYCEMAKKLLDEIGMEYKEIDISGNEKLREEMIKLSGRMTVPQIFINDIHIGGYEDLAKKVREGELPIKHKK